MLTFLFAIAAIWSLFWLVKYTLGWSNSAALSNSQIICSSCANAVTLGTPATSTPIQASNNPTARNGVSITSSTTAPTSVVKGTRSRTGQNVAASAKPTQALGCCADTQRKADAAALVKAAREEARAEAAS